MAKSGWLHIGEAGLCTPQLWMMLNTNNDAVASYCSSNKSTTLSNTALMQRSGVFATVFQEQVLSTTLLHSVLDCSRAAAGPAGAPALF